MTADPVIDAHGLGKRYGSLVALREATFQVEAGEIFGILGPNGAGKTTLVEILEGLNSPGEGAARVMGFEVTRDPTAVKARVGVQLQASSYHRYLTLREILELFGSFYPKHADPMALLEQVHLDDRADSRIDQLSGGMQQRFSIVAALVNDPALVFFDEPTAGLDPDARRDLWDLVRDVRSRGTTVVMTTHYMEEAQQLCDRVAFLYEGEIAAIDTPAGHIRRLHAPYRISLTSASPLDAARVAALAAVEEVRQAHTADGYVLALRAREAPQTAEALTELAREAGVTIIDLSIEPADLEDVFLALTGRELARA